MYRRGTTFYFATPTTAGMGNVPVGYKFIVNSTSSEYLLDSNTGLVAGSTVQDAITAGLTTQLGSAGTTTIDPVLSFTTPVPENTSNTITIDNFDAEATYTFSSDVGTVNWSSGNTATFDSADITSGGDLIGTIECYAGKIGELLSGTASSIMTVLQTILPTPTFTGSVLVADQETIVNITDINYDASITYFPSANDGVTVTQNAGVYTFTLPALGTIPVDYVVLSVYGTRTGDQTSLVGTWTVAINGVASTATDTIVDNLTESTLNTYNTI